MHSILALWLPTLLSAVAVFILSSIVHMVVPWHKNDYVAFPDEAAVLDSLRMHNLPPGEYMAPRPSSRESMSSPEFKEKVKRGPLVILNIQSGDSVSMGRPLILWFLYVLVVAALAGHVAFAAARENPDGRFIFHNVALTALLGYTAALWQGVIWFRRPWMVALKSTIDGAIYAVVTAAIFVYFWPK
jgi:hypothetical protein